jgi:hypothetical protein
MPLLNQGRSTKLLEQRQGKPSGGFVGCAKERAVMKELLFLPLVLSWLLLMSVLPATPMEAVMSETSPMNQEISGKPALPGAACQTAAHASWTSQERWV